MCYWQFDRPTSWLAIRANGGRNGGIRFLGQVAKKQPAMADAKVLPVTQQQPA